jgi:hypothetical protein
MKRMKRIIKPVRLGVRLRNWFIILFLGLMQSFQTYATETSAVTSSTDEYRVKAAFIYYFIAYTQWPDNIDKTLNLCIYGKDFFGHEIDQLQTRPVNQFAIAVSRLTDLEKVHQCQALFISKSETAYFSSILDRLQGETILTIADSTHAAKKGVNINMHLVENKVKFEINLGTARHAGLTISARLLQLATKIYQ